jgi:hypothetical protein
MEVASMSLYVDFQTRIQESDIEEAIEILHDILEQGIDMKRVTACFVEPASASLQLRFATPHAVICLDSLTQLLNVIPAKDQAYFLQGFKQTAKPVPSVPKDGATCRMS